MSHVKRCRQVNMKMRDGMHLPYNAVQQPTCPCTVKPAVMSRNVHHSTSEQETHWNGAVPFQFCGAGGTTHQYVTNAAILSWFQAKRRSTQAQQWTGP